jgi:hypothetical protein
MPNSTTWDEKAAKGYRVAESPLLSRSIFLPESLAARLHLGPRRAAATQQMGSFAKTNGDGGDGLGKSSLPSIVLRKRCSMRQEGQGNGKSGMSERIYGTRR